MLTPEFPTDPAKAFALQRRLAQQVRLEPCPKRVRRIAGCDAALSPDGQEVVGVAVLLDFPDLTVLHHEVRRARLEMPYVPGLLSFREGPALLAAIRALPETPDLLMVDGAGIAHPRRLGIAAHLGVLLDLPSVGAAKSRLCGKDVQPGPLRGESAPLVDRGELVGCILRTRDGVKPLYVSPGHRCDISGAAYWVLACGKGLRLPEPTRWADRLAGEAKRAMGADPHSEDE
ncbi:MAG: deoxyribonuclease V [Pseudomonadota bacterium]|uniref:deoxyribonuclease V n=1 Tax=Thermithiobacillus tepidarius TaxID=929 RepID=UPI00040BB846|nr:deoxyribonuclease V [Thermithiobacillus tepidarius]